MHKSNYSVNKDLCNAVAYLKGMQKIKSDREIATRTGWGSAAVSKYLNGRQKATDAFLSAFEKAYKIKLADFRKSVILPKVKAQTIKHVPTSDFQAFMVSELMSIKAILQMLTETVGISKDALRAYLEAAFEEIDKENTPAG